VTLHEHIFWEFLSRGHSRNFDCILNTCNPRCDEILLNPKREYTPLYYDASRLVYARIRCGNRDGRAAKVKARKECSKKGKSDSGRLVTPLSHKVRVVQTQYRTNRRSARHALCVQVVVEGPWTMNIYAWVTWEACMKLFADRLLRATVPYRIYRRFSFARGHDNNRQDHDNA